MQEKVMFHVEKFLPIECPKCRHPFKKQNEDWAMLLGDIVDGKKVIRELDGYHIIICKKCENYTAQLPLESYQVSDKKFAEDLCATQGFVNLMEVRAVGNACRDMHTVYSKPSGIQVRDAMKDAKTDEIAKLLGAEKIAKVPIVGQGNCSQK